MCSFTTVNWAVVTSYHSKWWWAAADKHTKQGQEMGRGDKHFNLHAAKLVPEQEGRECAPCAAIV